MMYSLLLVNLISPFVMILVGFLLKKHPVTDMDSHNGYNTPASRKSQERWDYAQSIAPDNFISLGKTLGIIEIILLAGVLLLPISPYAGMIAGSIVGMVFFFLGFYKTDTEIEKRFTNR